MDMFNKICNEILTQFEHGCIFECSSFAKWKKEHCIGEVISEAKITDTDDMLLEDIFSLLKAAKPFSWKVYSYEDILGLSTRKTWRCYDYFRENCNTGFKFYVFVSDYPDISLLKSEFPSLNPLFDSASAGVFGVTWPFNYRETYMWLNRSIILNNEEPLKRIQHEVIHAWSGILNVDENKSYGTHDPEADIDKLDEEQKSFLELNSMLANESYVKKQVNYCIGQHGLEFESQVNDICDAFEYAFKNLVENRDKDLWVADLIKYVNSHIGDEMIISILKKFSISDIFNPNFSGYYQQKILLFFVLHGLLKDKSKLWYLDEALKTHFNEDMKL